MKDVSLARTAMPEFLNGGGEMGQRIREYDWSKTAIGPIDTWPKSLQTCIRIMLTSRQPIWIGWGKELIKFYNDPYKAIVGGKHPGALGKPASEVWKEIWTGIGPMLRQVMEEDSGTYVEEQLLIMERNGYPEETYYTFSYSPIPGDDGGTAGMICANTDDTDKVISKRQIETLTQLGKELSDCRKGADVFEKTLTILSKNPKDFPFTALYQLEGDTARLFNAGHTVYNLNGLPAEFNIRGQHPFSNDLAHAIEGQKPFSMIWNSANYAPLQQGPWEKPPNRVIVLPISQSGRNEPMGFFLIGTNPYRLINGKYQSFFDLIGDQVSTSLARVHVYEEEQKRLEALAEIDRAKTNFFSNISHEFRTPLTLLLGPIEDAMLEPEAVEANARRMEVAFRNALRMQKLVNMLLDFSRIEAGRMDAQIQSIDIGAFTEGLVSTFRSAIEKAGMALIVDCQVTGPAYADPDMWEKIVLNLMSNAFKYSRQGHIQVVLTEQSDRLVLTVADTGSGIPESELEKIFERFHRVQNVQSRSQEGTGIGLAMVRELVKLHQGTIDVTSKVGHGSTFRVSIPRRMPDTYRPPATPEAPVSAHQTATFLEDVTQWGLPAEHKPLASPAEPVVAPLTGFKVLLADDNRDMRQHIERLLARHYTVITVSNGEEAYNQIQQHQPDLVISDIMMPVLDGFALLQKIRGNADIRNTPVIFLSARAGEEAVVEGLNAGADDYLIKPFSSKELLAKISSQIKISKSRADAELQLRRLFNQAPVAITIIKRDNYVVELANEFYLELVEKDHSFIGKPLFDSLPELATQGIPELLNGVIQSGQSHIGKELRLEMRRKGRTETVFFNFVYHPLFENDGSVSGVFVVASEVTDLVTARESARQNAQALEKMVIDRTKELQTQKDFAETIMNSSAELIFVFDLQFNILTLNKKVEELYGLKKADVIGHPVRQYFSDLGEADMSGISRALSGEMVHNPRYHSRKTGKYYESFLIPLRNDDGKVYAILATAHDITDLIEASAKIKSSAEQLMRANETLLGKNKELEQFAYISSHDLQEPLRKIQTFSELVARHITDEDYATKYLEKIDASAARMSALIKDILAYSKISNTEKQQENVDLNTVLEHVKTDFELLISEKQAQIISTHLPQIRGNRFQFHQLFSNLISNSLKFTEVAPILTISCEVVEGPVLPVNSAINRELPYYRLVFQDNGIGFEKEYSEQIFGMFQRLQNRKDYSGTGIGLALCRKIVESHEGIIIAESAKGKGATFIIYLPAR